MNKPRLENAQQLQRTEEILLELRERMEKTAARPSPIRDISLKGMREFEAKLIRDINEYRNYQAALGRKQAV